MTDNCSICGSDRILEGPAYDKTATTCMDCGSQFNREIIVEPEQESVSVAIQEQELAIPEGGFSTIAEAQEHLKKLQALKKGLSYQREDRPSKKHPESDIDPGLIMSVHHYYQRNSESWNAVMDTAKGERAVRNFNVLIMVHNHTVGKGCTKSCRELLSENS